MGRGGAALILAALVLAGGAAAETSAAARARQPELFDAQTGLRIARYRAPTPEDVPGGRVIDAAGLAAARAAGALLLDVSLDGAGVFFGAEEGWVGFTARETVPGAVWLPGAGRGTLDPEEEAYVRGAVEALTGGDRARPVALFCVADCWMSWNAVRRLAAWGWRDLAWYPLGTDGWTEAGGTLAPAAPHAP